MDIEIEKRFELADIWKEALDESRKCSLEAEVIVTAFEFLGVTKESLEGALAYALGEWDIP